MFPQLQALDRSEQQGQEQSVPRQTSAASFGSKRSPPDLRREHWIRVLTGPQPQRISEDIPDRMTERMSEDMADTYARKNNIR